MAHPDDETFGLGGTLALYASRGVKVHLVCATRGEAGTVAPEFMTGYDTVADLRVDELLCAAEKLGLEEVNFLDYRDSGMIGTKDNEHPKALAQADIGELVGSLVHFIRQIRPQVVVTFDPEGGYGHPDHLAVHRATVEAYTAAANPDRYPEAGPAFQPQKLYFFTIRLRFVKPMLALMRLVGRDPRKWGRNQDIDLTEVLATGFPVNAKINYRSVSDVKREATRCHASQLDMGPGTQGLLGTILRLNRIGDEETFMRADPPAVNGRVERDLFQDVILT